MKMLVVADDFTGASDTGVQLAKKGARTEVMLSSGKKTGHRADVLVINTESRGCGAVDAAQAVMNALADIPVDNVLIYKKIDSTFRGNIGAEIEALLLASGKTLALVAAAIPATGRTTLYGHCLVNEVPVDQTEYASDPKTPVTSACIKTLIGQQSTLPVTEIHLPQIRSGQLAQQFAAFQGEQPGILVLDALNYQDLSLIAQAAMTMERTPLLAGAAGLADALPVSCWLTPRKALPVLIVAGSMSEVTRRQVDFALRSQRALVVDIEVSQLLNPDQTDWWQHVVQQAVSLLNQGRHCLLRTSRSETDRYQVAALCQRWQLDRSQLGLRLSEKMGQLTLAITEKACIGGLFLTGGDMAIAVANALGAEGYRISAEVAPCVPCGTFINSEIDDLPVITKAGGFGAESILCDALAFIEEMYCDH